MSCGANMTPRYFKELMCELFNDSAYRVRTTKFVGDFWSQHTFNKRYSKNCSAAKEIWTNYKDVQGGAER